MTGKLFIVRGPSVAMVHTKAQPILCSGKLIHGDLKHENGCDISASVPKLADLGGHYCNTL